MPPPIHITAKERSSEGHAIRLLLILFLCCFAPSRFIPSAVGAEPFLQKGDVIALVGGEDMVVAGELGYLELLLTRALPEHRLRFRNLAWEGDTVFEQRRDLNFPPLEAQLDQIGATVVICQFGQMESLAAAERKGTADNTEDADNAEKREKEPGKSSVSSASSASSVVKNPAARESAVKEFIAAYEKLIERMSAGGKRRIVLIEPTRPLTGQTAGSVEVFTPYSAGAEQIAKRGDHRWISFAKEFSLLDDYRANATEPQHRAPLFRSDSMHLSDRGQDLLGATVFLSMMRGFPWKVKMAERDRERLLTLIRAKNRLWFDYWRVQNWAFLAGDRTTQPSSRDHRDPTKRWFPAEREEFLPLIAAKEAEIDALAAKLAQ